MSHDPLGLAGPSPHLSWAELACKDAKRTPYPVEWRVTRAIALAVEFELLRKAINGQPIRVLSGYRTPAHNRAVGGARLSQHVAGRALDLLPPAGWKAEELFAVARVVAGQADSRIRGLGLYPGFVHVDVRPSERLAVWGGTRALADVAIKLRRTA